MQAGHGPASGTPMMERYNSTFMVDVWKELFAKAIIHYAVRPLYKCSSPILDLPASDCTLTQDELNACSQGGAATPQASPNHVIARLSSLSTNPYSSLWTDWPQTRSNSPQCTTMTRIIAAMNPARGDNNIQ